MFTLCNKPDILYKITCKPHMINLTDRIQNYMLTSSYKPHRSYTK